MPTIPIVAQTAATVPFALTPSPTGEAKLVTAYAEWNGTGASGPFLACLAIYAADGTRLGRVFPSIQVAAGNSAVVTYAPFPGGVASVADYLWPADVRTYYGTWSGGNTSASPSATPIAPRTKNGALSYYAKCVIETPGLMHWWRFDKALPVAFGQPSAPWPPYFANSAGATTLRTQGSGTPTLVPTLIANQSGTAVKMNGGYLDGVDYRANAGTVEVQTIECWVNFNTIGSDVGLVGEWSGNAGWMLYASTPNKLRLYAGNAILEWDGLTTGIHHLVGVIGGLQGPAGDYISRVYCDGVNVVSGSLVGSGGIDNLTTRVEIGNYSNGGGASSLDGIVDEVALYSRMLQPVEILQHYQAGVGLIP